MESFYDVKIGDTVIIDNHSLERRKGTIVADKGSIFVVEDYIDKNRLLFRKHNGRILTADGDDLVFCYHQEPWDRTENDNRLNRLREDIISVLKDETVSDIVYMVADLLKRYNLVKL